MTPSERGFVFVPIIIVVVAVLLLGGAATGVGVYVAKNKSAAEPLPTSQFEMVDVSPQDPPIMSSEPVEIDSSPTPELSPSDEPIASTTEPAVAAATTVVPTRTTQPIGTEASIPLIVEQEFAAVFGRAPNGAESAFWKERYRKNSADRQKIRAWMESTNQSQQTASNSDTVSSQQNADALQKYLLLKGLLGSQVTGTTSTTPATSGTSPEEQALLERQRQLQEKQAEERAQLAAERHAQDVAACRTAEDINFARALEAAQGGFSGRGTFTSGFRNKAIQDLVADHEYRLSLCN